MYAPPKTKKQNKKTNNNKQTKDNKTKKGRPSLQTQIQHI